MASVVEVRDEKIGGTFGVDKNFVPVGWLWKVRRTIVFDDGSSTDTFLDVPFSAEDLATHIENSLAAQASDIAADRAERDDLRDKLAKALEALQVVRAADARWDDEFRSKVVDALP